ncbi:MULTISPECIES: hypothetical protein [unclassified Acidiphilium]|uniref:hypothetical protein n=1 Tax=unclassified Acidiphilium TaxID=2617493 RepID=UPI0025C4261C|nr:MULTISPECIES: hypothetical protein [unclassified Acidiphilium]HQT62537.1 hypothetical protein [Acidiphilium sp.]
MPVALSAIRNELLPGLRGVIGKYQMIDRIYDKIYDTGTSEMALERTTEMRFLGLAQLKSEGGSTTFDNDAGERYVWNQEHMEIGLGYAITRKAIDDNLYKRQFNPSNLGLMESFAQTKEIYGATFLNTSNVVNGALGGDGQPFCSTAHPIDGGTYANRPSVDVDLNESTLLNAQVNISSTIKDQAGLLVFARARKAVIPPALEPTMLRLLKTELRPGTADNDVNVIPFTAGGLPDGYVVNPFLTSQYAWFLLTNIKGLLYLQRVPFETDMQVDFVTDNLMVKGYERYSFAGYNPRSIWGSFPTS